MVETTFGHICFYLVAHEDGVISGILPLVQIRNRLFGNRMISIVSGQFVCGNWIRLAIRISFSRLF